MRIAIDWRSAGKDIAFFAVVGAFLAFIDPYEASQSTSFLAKFVYWTGLIFVGGVAGRLGFHLAERFQKPPHWTLGILCASAISALAVSIALYAMAVYQYGFELVPFSEFPRIYGLVFVIAAGISGVAYMFDRMNEPPEQTTTATDSENPIKKFLERLPVKFRTSQLYAISSEDHYLRVHTSMGEELILMRLADALRELDGADGLQTHRSWWVSKDGVADLIKDSGKMTLILKSGTEVPVSRTYSKDVRAAFDAS